MEPQEKIIELVAGKINHYNQIKIKIITEYKMGSDKFRDIMNELVEKKYLEKEESGRNKTLYKIARNENIWTTFEYEQLEKKLSDIIKNNDAIFQNIKKVKQKKIERYYQKLMIHSLKRISQIQIEKNRPDLKRRIYNKEQKLIQMYEKIISQSFKILLKMSPDNYDKTHQLLNWELTNNTFPETTFPPSLKL